MNTRHPMFELWCATTLSSSCLCPASPIPLLLLPSRLLLPPYLFSPILSSLRSSRHSFYRRRSFHLFSFPSSTPISSYPLLSPFIALSHSSFTFFSLSSYFLSSIHSSPQSILSSSADLLKAVCLVNFPYIT